MASTPPAADSEIQPETVEVLLATVKGLVDAENTRSESFNSRGSGVAGFAGIVVSVSAAAGPKVLSKDVGDAVRWVAAALLAVALAEPGWVSSCYRLRRQASLARDRQRGSLVRDQTCVCFR